MPVTLKTTAHLPRPWLDASASTAEQLLAQSCPAEKEESYGIIQTLFPQDSLDDNHFSSSENGFVGAVLEAYNQSHHLIIRPEDVWFSILSQVSIFVNVSPEEIQNLFVALEARKDIPDQICGAIETFDVGTMAREMTQLIQDNLVDKELRDWIMPASSTTTESDKIVAAIVMMGIPQKSSGFPGATHRGIPSVTMLGEKAD